MKLLITASLLLVALLSVPLLMAAKSLDELRLEAEKGDSDAQVHLGGIYQFGSEGVAKDATEAAKWYRKAAEQGVAGAQATGDIPQNVNYAVKSAYALALLEPYLDASAPEPKQSGPKLSFEDMVAKAQQSVVLILAY
jgi:TPR repeat protein